MSRQASGFRAWVYQRITAVLLLLFFVYLLLTLSFAPPADFVAWVEWLSQPLVRIGLLIFVGALLLHSWVGVRDAIIDYVHPLALRIAALTLLALWLIGTGLWVLTILG